ncbi:MAG TPA: hypothetical protein VFE10_10750 [Phenylobacterium sp.]|jgi:hypothetical protein|nr:hypothetical protein [Phenylobacterium sp.]
MRIKAAPVAGAQLPAMDQDLNPPIVAPIEGARPETPHPLLRFWRGLGEVALFFGEGALAVADFLFGRRTPRPRRRKSHPVEKAAPFPIND